MQENPYQAPAVSGETTNRHPWRHAIKIATGLALTFSLALYVCAMYLSVKPKSIRAEWHEAVQSTCGGLSVACLSFALIALTYLRSSATDELPER